MTAALAPLLWPADKLAEALEAVARASGHSPERAIDPPPAALLSQGDVALQSWLDAALAPLGLEAEPVSAPYGEVVDLVRRSGPALARLEVDGEQRLALILRGGERRVTVLGPDLRPRRVRASDLATQLRRPFEGALAPRIDALLALATISPRRREAVRRALVAQQLEAPVGGLWALVPLPGAPFARQLRAAGVGRDLTTMLLAHAVAYSLLLAAWWLMGKAALEGRLEPGWIAGWVLLLVSTVPIQSAVVWLQGRCAIAAGAILKRRLLYGVTRLATDEIRHRGIGGLLGTVIEAESVEAFAASGGAAVLLGVVELVAAGVVLGLGGSWLQVLLLIGWLVVGSTLGWRYHCRLRAWTRHRVALTQDLVERLVGHRTRLAQLPPSRWHEGEDEGIERHFELSRQMDGASQRIAALVPRGWMLLAVVGMAPGFVAGSMTPSAIAASIGGAFLGYLALNKIVVSLSPLAGAAIAWEQIAPLFSAAARHEEPGVIAALPAARSDGALIEARDLHFQYPGRPPVLSGCDLRIESDDRILLEGGSGGGKSTLASLLVGLREPARGLLLLRGLDRPTLGARGWRRRVAAAPQFHENHVLSGTLAFNLLMGRSWPPPPEDLEEAEELCHALGLGPLLARMPAGLLQTVGETGWQLSHGERSRLFQARALLQDADLVVLDESFAALDPESLRQTLHTTLERAPALLVIAHP